MSLEINKSITLSATSMIEGTRVKVYSANLGTSENSNNSNETIINVDVYNKNRAAVRKDDQVFQTKMYEIEDEIAAESDAVSEESQK